MIDPADMAACREAIRTGSRSFHAASKLLPAKVRDPALALYAFCRLADDAVDLQADKAGAVLSLRDRLDQVYAGRPKDAAADRAFSDVVNAFDMPQALPDALLEGFAWDAEERRYQTLSDVRAYSARVAAAVGAMMSVLMGVREADTLARACDLGVAMQLTNIARDVGEDAREGRLYLPLDWFDEAGLDPDAFLADPRPCPEVARMTQRLLSEAKRLYIRSEPGIAALPLSSRGGIFAARHIYAAIGKEVRRNNFDNITHRAHTGTGRKIGLAALSMMQAVGVMAFPRSPVLFAPALPETAFLVDAAAHRVEAGRPHALIVALEALEMRDRSARVAG